MRFYRNFGEALNELSRELKEMGLKIHPKSVQNKNVEGNPDFDTLEIQNYTYTVTGPKWEDIPLKDPDWCSLEFAERTSGRDLNPGTAWKKRESYWSQFFSKKREGKFDYAYPERMNQPLRDVISALRKDLSTRRAFLPIFDRQEDHQNDFDCRIPCSLGYWFYYRQNRLNMTYLQRSADWSEHFNNDIYLAFRLQMYVAQQLSVDVGHYSHWLGSLHVFAHDVKDVF